MKALMAAADGGGLSKLETLDIAFNDTIGEEGIEALAEAIEYAQISRRCLKWEYIYGTLPSLGELVMDMEQINARLRAACEDQGVELIGQEFD